MISSGLRTRGIVKQSHENKPLITVITVVRNGEATVENTILSVINQTYTNIEYIIVDGASTDGTLNIVNKFEDKIDYLISEPDNGIYDAMNKGICLATGDWIFFLGADDVFYSNAVVTDILKNFNDRRCIYYGNVYFKYEKYKYGGRFYMLKLLYKNISHQSIFYPKHVYQKNKYLTKYSIWADYFYNISLYRKECFKYMDYIITIYNDRGYSSSNEDRQFKNDMLIIITRYFGIFMAIAYLVSVIPYKICCRIYKEFDRKNKL